MDIHVGLATKPSESDVKSEEGETQTSVCKEEMKGATTSVVVITTCEDSASSSSLNVVSKSETFTSSAQNNLTDEKEEIIKIKSVVAEEESLADNIPDMNVVVNKDARIYLNPDGTLVFSPPGTNESIPIILETGSSARGSIPVTDTTAVNPNYLVVVENLESNEVASSSVHENVVYNSDSSISTSVPSLLRETQTAVSQVGEDGTGFSPQTITMVFDNSSQLGSDNIVVEPNSFIAYNNQTAMSSEQLTLETLPVVSEKSESPQGMYDVNQSSFIDISPLNVVSSDTPCSTTIHHKPNTQATQTAISEKVWKSTQRRSKKYVLSDMGTTASSALQIEEKLGADSDSLSCPHVKDKDKADSPYDELSIAKLEKQKSELRLLEQSHLRHHMKQVQMKQGVNSLSDMNEGQDEMEIDDEDETDEKMCNMEMEHSLKQAGITDETPIFTSIRAAVNSKLLSHIPGCQQFLLDKFQDSSQSDSALVFHSDTDCTVDGNLESVVRLFNAVKQLMKLKSKTTLDFRVDRGGNCKLDKGVNCDLLKPFVSSRGRQPRCSQKVAEMGFVSELDIFPKEYWLDQSEPEMKRTSSRGKSSGKKGKRKRGRPRRVVKSCNQKYKLLLNDGACETAAINTIEESETSVTGEEFMVKSACVEDVKAATEVLVKHANDDVVLEAADDAVLVNSITEVGVMDLNSDNSKTCSSEGDEHKNQESEQESQEKEQGSEEDEQKDQENEEGSQKSKQKSQENEQRSLENSDTAQEESKLTSLILEDSSLMDPVQQRLLEEQIKYKQIMDLKLKQAEATYSLTCTDASESNTALTQEMETTDTLTTASAENPPEDLLVPTVLRRKRGRPRKQGDTNVFVEKVQPRNPLTESAATKQQRNYEENVSFKFFCTSCSFKSKRQSHFLSHLQCHKETEKKYTCGHCGFITISLPTFKRHELKHKKNLFRCDLCEAYTTDRKELLSRHIKLKHSMEQKEPRPDKLNCDQCRFSCFNQQQMTRHKVVHARLTQVAENDPLNCPDCKKNFKSRMHLQRHVRDVHGPDARPHLCDKCGKAFKRTDTLQQHKLVHISRTARSLPFKCRSCEKGFRSPAHLKEHMAMHSSERPFLCQYCGAAFKTQPVQKKHILTLHVKPRAHVCTVCCRQFNTKNALQRHENTHTKFENPANTIFIIERNSVTDQKGGEQKTPTLTNQDSQPTNLTVGEGTTMAVDGQLTNCLVQDMIGTAAAASAIEEPLEQSGPTLQQAYLPGRQAGTTLFYFTGELHQL